MSMAQLKAVSQTAKSILDRLTAGLAPGESRKLDNGGAGIMPVCVERLSATTYSVAHYFEQNGDLVPDPDVVFWKSPTGGYYPMSIQHGGLGVYQQAMQLDHLEKPASFRPRAQRDIATFVTTWMRNITIQQNLPASAKGVTL